MGDEYERGEVKDRGLFGGRHHGHKGEYNETEAYASEVGGGRRRPEGMYAGGGEAETYASEIGGGYGRPPPQVAYEGEGGGYGGGGYGGGGYAEQEGYGRRPGGEVSDLGTGAGYGRPSDVPGEYEEGRHHGRHHGGEEDEEERKHKRYAEEAAAAAVGYGLYERHEKRDDEERLEDLGYDEDGKKKHHFFRSDE